MHPYAHVASRSAEAARKQGKYKEMHDKIFEGQEVWSKGNAERLFIGYAEEIGLDTEVFTADMNSAEMNQIVMEQRKEGVRMGVNATPTFYINGIKVENNPQTYMGFKVLIDRELD
jgi:protein-disulfide isomerase